VLGFIVRRVLISIPILWGVVTLVFVGIHLSPGDPAATMLFGHGTAEEVARLHHELGLDEPLPVQYWNFVTGAVHMDFGESYVSQQPVSQEILTRFPYTAQLAGAAILLAVGFGLVTGVLAALYSRSMFGRSVIMVAVLGISVPDFFLGTMLALIFGVKLHWLPVEGIGDVRNLILPASTLAIVISAVLTRLIRSSLLDVLGTEFIRVIRAKGVSSFVLVMKHALKNALIPVVTILGLIIAQLLAGAVVVENVFAWPGLGSYAVSAVLARDYPVVEGITFFFAVILITANLLVDISYAFLDPRIRIQGSRGGGGAS
jgi:peptide/nickel transport system permease protein